jgi:chromate reductase
VDAVLFITPKNNRSIPGALKNAIDWASRPWGAELLRPHPGRRARASIGAIGTAVGQQSLRAVLSFCNAKPMTSQEAYIHYSPEVFTDDGEITNESTKEFLRNYSPRPVYGPGEATAAVRRIHDEVRRSAPLRTTP